LAAYKDKAVKIKEPSGLTEIKSAPASFLHDKNQYL
jgi:hypothetical protein